MARKKSDSKKSLNSLRNKKNKQEQARSVLLSLRRTGTALAVAAAVWQGNQYTRQVAKGYCLNSTKVEPLPLTDAETNLLNKLKEAEKKIEGAKYMNPQTLIDRLARLSGEDS